MSTRTKQLTKEEIARACEAPGAVAFGPIVTPKELATLLGLSVKTIYEWMSKGRLDGTYRKRGKHNLIWRDRAIALIFNSPEWD